MILLRLSGAVNSYMWQPSPVIVRCGSDDSGRIVGNPYLGDYFRVARNSGAIERDLARTGGEEFTSTSTRGSLQNRRASSTLTNGASRLLAGRDGIKSRSVLTYASAKTMFAA